MREFYQGKRVLVTGHTGFKGTWLCWLLSALGAEVFGYALPPQNGCLYCKAAPPLAGERLADMRDADSLRRAAADFAPDLVFHLAAHSHLDGSYVFPQKIFEVTVMGTVQLLETLRCGGGGVPTVVVTSDKCYTQSLQGRPCREDDPFGAAEAYSTSKACQDLAAQCYRLSFETMPVATARASNTIGGGDFNQTRLIPYLLDCFSRGEPAKLRNPSYIRSWQYVLDVLWGYLLLGKALAQGIVREHADYNFGPAADGFQTVERVAEELAGHFEHARVQWLKGERSNQTAILRLDSSKAHRELAWTPICGFEETLERTASFQKRSGDYSGAELCRDWTERYILDIQTKAER